MNPGMNAERLRVPYPILRVTKRDFLLKLTTASVNLRSLYCNDAIERMQNKTTAGGRGRVGLLNLNSV